MLQQSRQKGKEEIRTGELWLYCLLREVVKQRTPIKAGCGTIDMMKRYEGEAELTITYISPLKMRAGNHIHLTFCQKSAL